MDYRIFLALCLLSASTGAAQPVYDDYFTNESLRLDYHHAGTSDTSFLFFDGLKKEKYWAGSRTNLIDPLRYGDMMIEVSESSSGKLLYSKGYSTLFIEWQTTEEAKKRPESYPESIVMPFPKDSVIVRIFKRDKKLVFHLLMTYVVDPKNQFIENRQQAYFKSVNLHNNGAPSKKVDVVIIPEGYTQAEMLKFKEDAEAFTALFFEWEPFKKNKENFNFSAVLAPSQDSGTDMPGTNTWKKTLLNSTFHTFNSERYLTARDFQKVRDVASTVPYDQIIILVNSDKYGGGGIYNFYSICTSNNPQSAFVFMHEFGHAFASLADEYYSSDVSYSDFFDLSVEPYQPNITTLQNFDSKWKELLEPGIPIPTPPTEEYINKVGVFEGGGYLEKGIYRPTFDGTMKSAVINGFGPVNERAIQRMIDLYTE